MEFERATVIYWRWIKDSARDKRGKCYTCAKTWSVNVVVYCRTGVQASQHHCYVLPLLSPSLLYSVISVSLLFIQLFPFFSFKIPWIFVHYPSFCRPSIDNVADTVLEGLRGRCGSVSGFNFIDFIAVVSEGMSGWNCVELWSRIMQS